MQTDTQSALQNEINIADPSEHPLMAEGQPQGATRDEILDLQERLVSGVSSGQLQSPEMPLRHIFTDGAYARELTMPAGCVVVGKIHKHAHLNFITKGKVAVATEFGKEVFTAPYTFVSEPGTKRVVYILEDTVWTTVHVTTETDLEKIEDYVIAKSFEEYDEYARSRKEQL